VIVHVLFLSLRQLRPVWHGPPVNPCLIVGRDKIAQSVDPQVSTGAEIIRTLQTYVRTPVNIIVRDCDRYLAKLTAFVTVNDRCHRGTEG